MRGKAWLALFLALTAACGDGTEAAPNLGSGEAGVQPGTNPSGSATDAAAIDAATGPSSGGASDAGGSPAAQPDGATSGSSPEAGSAGQLDAGQGADGKPPTADAGTSPVADAGPTPDAAPAEIPAPVSAPSIWGYGLGVTDLPAAVKFYTEVMKTTVEKENIKRDDRIETTLYASAAMRGARLVLMKFDDQRNTRKITAKLVWQASSPSAVNSAASKYPDYKSRITFPVVQFDGPDTYIQEVGSIFVSGSTAKVPFLIAAGFAVGDLAQSRRFYTSLGMDESSTGTFPVTDATGSGTITEWTVKWAAGTGVVLQSWSPARNTKDNPLKVILMVPDAQAIADKVVAAGGSIAKPAERTPVYDNRLLIVAKDRDGYILEIVQ